MNQDQFKDHVLVGDVVASWSLTQKMAGSKPFSVVTNIFVTDFSEFRENI